MELEIPITERRRQTRSGIYHYLYNSAEFCSKQTLSTALSLSLPTVYQNLAELMDAGLVGFSGEQRSTGGRRAMGLSIVSDARVAIGVSITENRLRLVAADLRLKELAYKKIYHEPLSKFGEFAPFLAQQIELFIDENGLSREKLLGVGITAPAVFAADGSRIEHAPTLHLRNTSVQALTGRLPYPVHIENDGTSGGYAEWFIRADRRNMAYLSLENGVGGSVLVNGDLYAGDNRRSGEFGHMCVEPGGLPCKCGKRGCLEAYCSASRISDELGITLNEFFSGLDAHVPEYEDMWTDLLRHLAVGIANIRMALDCDVVLGGFLSQFLPPYMPQLRDYVCACNNFEQNADYVYLSALPRHSAPLGGALHFVREFLDSI